MSTTDEKSPLPDPKDNIKPINYRKVWAARQAVSQFADPCDGARQASMACLSKTGDRNQCMEYFQAYKDCKQLFLDQLKEDRRAGKRIS
ncbi:hypothetical protein C8J56DRAFT_928018 [Mycena floridula]|nr:hypothetical protein C8J56DRAFT_928018 [Mycena floridula]